MKGANKVSLAIALLVLGGPGCSPSRTQDTAATLRLKQQCHEAGAKARAEWVARYPEEHFSDEPEYAYNVRLNTCLYCDSYTDNGPVPLFPNVKSREDRFILDVYSNKVLIEYTAHDGMHVPGTSSKAEFEAARRRLMGTR